MDTPVFQDWNKTISGRNLHCDNPIKYQIPANKRIKKYKENSMHRKNDHTWICVAIHQQLDLDILLVYLARGISEAGSFSFSNVSVPHLMNGNALN